MKLVIERAALVRALAHAQSIVEKRQTIQILSNVLLEAKEGALSLTATDMDLAIVETIAAQVDVEGAITVSAHMIYDIARKLPDGAQILLDATKPGQLTLISDTTQVDLQTLPKDEYPEMTGGEMSQHFSIPAPQLRALIEKTQFAISTEETRYYLNGIYIHTLDVNGTRMLRAVATDGHRLAKMEIEAPQGAGDISGVIIPRKTVVELNKLIDNSDQLVNVSLSDSKIRFAFTQAVLTSKLIDGQFPEYERVIPKGNDNRFVVDKSKFAHAVDLISTVSTDKLRAVKLGISAQKLELSASSAQDGNHAKQELAAQYDGEALQVGFNSRYLLDVTRQIEGHNMLFMLGTSVDPCVILDEENASVLYVLMPMRV